MNTWTPEQRAWLATRPPRVQAVAEQYPGYQCYRATDNRGHYWIYSYTESGKKRQRITVKLIHGRDSYLPGVMVFGVNPNTLIPCGCDNWQMPTEEQTQRTKLELADGQETN